MGLLLLISITVIIVYSILITSELPLRGLVGRDQIANLLLTALLVIVAAVQAWTMRAQTVIANTQASISQTQTNISYAQSRPWASVFSISISEVSHRPAGFEVALSFSVKNYGQTPAQHLAIAQEIYFRSVNPKIDMRHVCSQAERQWQAITLFPTETQNMGLGYTAPEADFASMSSNGLPSVLVCVAYKLSPTTEFHRTPYAFYLGAADGKSAVMPILRGSNIPIASLVLVNLQTADIGAAD